MPCALKKETLEQWLMKMTQAAIKLSPQLVADFSNALTQKREFKENDLIYEKGAEGDCMHFVASGRIAAVTPDQKILCIFEHGEYVGEWALLTADRRSSDVITLSQNAETYELSSVQYAILKKSHPELHSAFEKNSVKAYKKLQKDAADMQAHLGEEHYAARLQGLEKGPLAAYNNFQVYPTKTTTEHQFLVTIKSKDEYEGDTQLVLPRRYFRVTHNDCEQEFAGAKNESKASTSRFAERVQELTAAIRALIRANGKLSFEEQFTAFDTDKNGLLDKDEFAMGCAVMGIEICTEEISMIWPLLDTDGSGSVELEEFVAFASDTSGEALQARDSNCRDASKNRRHLRIQCRSYLPSIITNIIFKIHDELLAGFYNTFQLVPGAAISDQNVVTYFGSPGTEHVRNHDFGIVLRKHDLRVPPMAFEALWNLLTGGEEEIPIAKLSSFLQEENDADINRQIARRLEDLPLDEVEVAMLGSMVRLPDLLVDTFTPEAHRFYRLATAQQKKETDKSPKTHSPSRPRQANLRKFSSIRRSTRQLDIGSDNSSEFKPVVGSLPGPLLKLTRSVKWRRESSLMTVAEKAGGVVNSSPTHAADLRKQVCIEEPTPRDVQVHEEKAEAREQVHVQEQPRMTISTRTAANLSKSAAIADRPLPSQKSRRIHKEHESYVKSSSCKAGRTETKSYSSENQLLQFQRTIATDLTKATSPLLMYERMKYRGLDFKFSSGCDWKSRASVGPDWVLERNSSNKRTQSLQPIGLPLLTRTGLPVRKISSDTEVSDFPSYVIGKITPEQREALEARGLLRSAHSPSPPSTRTHRLEKSRKRLSGTAWQSHVAAYSPKRTQKSFCSHRFTAGRSARGRLA